jgi:transposase-like protein
MFETYERRRERPLDDRAIRAKIANLKDERRRVVVRISASNERLVEIDAALAELTGLTVTARRIGQPMQVARPVAAAPVLGDLLGRADATAGRLSGSSFTVAELAGLLGVAPSALRRWVRERVASGLLELVGKFSGQSVYEWWQGATVRELVVTEEALLENEEADAELLAEDAELLAEIEPIDIGAEARNWVRLQDKPFSRRNFIEASGYDDDTVATEILDSLVQGGMLRNVGFADLPLFEYIRSAAGIERVRVAEPVVNRNGGPVAGTGKKLVISNPDTRALVAKIEELGGEVTHAPQGHLEVSYGKQKCLISSTPSSQRSVLNDRARVRKMGLGV